MLNHISKGLVVSTVVLVSQTTTAAPQQVANSESTQAVQHTTAGTDLNKPQPQTLILKRFLC